MSDIAQILGVSGPKPASNLAGDGPPPLPANHQPSRAMKLQGMPREVMGLLSGSQDAQSAELPPVVPSFNPDVAKGKQTASTTTNGREKGSVKIGAKWISIKKPARQWTWASFASSSRTDGAMFNHWVRANVEYPDYPYARFDIHLDPITYSEEEYRRFLTNDLWTKSETDQLLELSRRFELRWPVIYDRWIEMHYSPKDAREDMRKIEDLQHRYYSVAALLTQSRIAQEAATEAQVLASSTPEPSDDPKAAAEALIMETAAARALASSDPQHQPLMANLGAGISNKVYDLDQERERRSHMEILWKRTKEEEVEEAELRKELKHVEAQLRKVKKSGGHIIAASNGPGGAAGSMLNSAASSRNTSRATTPVPGGTEISPAMLDEAFASTAPTPVAQTPYLQSGRLAPPNMGGSAGLNKILLTRMDAVLEELKVPKRVLPTKRVCDMYDTVRKDILTLLILQKNVLQKEGLVQSKRLKLAKMGGNVRVVDEETLLGIAPPQVASATSGASTANRGGKGSRPGKSKSSGGGGGGGKAKSAPKAKSGDDTNKTGTDPKKTGTDSKKTSTDPKKTGTTELKEAPGGKQARKSGVKRKKKPDSKSPQPPPSSAGTTATVATSATTPAGAAAPAATKSAEAGDGKSAKKRSRKSNTST
jgi:DNA methyltransferase 1-associated protein 1